MNDLFIDPFSGVTTSHSHISDQASVVNVEQDEVSKSLPVVKKREKVTKRKALQFDSNISLSKDDIEDLQQGLLGTVFEPTIEFVSLEWCIQQLQEPPICNKKSLISFRGWFNSQRLLDTT
jgi:hypothetical protein